LNNDLEQKYLSKIMIEHPTKEQWGEIKKDIGELIIIVKILEEYASKNLDPIYTDDFCWY
jgi:hypothetical protein